MSVPLAWNKAGLPLGMMFSARFGDEATLFRLAGQLEQARPWKEQIASSVCAAKTPIDKAQPYSAARKALGAARSTPIPANGLIRRLNREPERPDRQCAGGHRQHSGQPERRASPRKPRGRAERRPAAAPRGIPARACADRGPWLFQTRSRPDGGDPLQVDGAPRDNGKYYVDETIGENSAPVVNGPLSREEAIQMVDDRESDARRRFEQLKSEMTGRQRLSRSGCVSVIRRHALSRSVITSQSCPTDTDWSCPKLTADCGANLFSRRTDLNQSR